MLGKPREQKGWGEGKERKQRQAKMRAAELWDNYGVIILGNFSGSGYLLSRLWCKQLNREQFLPWWRKQQVLKQLCGYRVCQRSEPSLSVARYLRPPKQCVSMQSTCIALIYLGTHHATDLPFWELWLPQGASVVLIAALQCQIPCLYPFSSFSLEWHKRVS